MAIGEYDRMKRFIKLDKLFRDIKGKSYEEILIALEDDDISIIKRTLLKDINDFEHLGAVFVRDGRGRETLIRYKDHSYSVFDKINTDMEALSMVIDKLRIIDDQRFAMVRISLAQLKMGISESDIPIMSFQANARYEGLENIEPLTEAILNKYPVRIKYEPFNKEVLTLDVHPYHLRQHNNRWVLVGWNDERSKICTYPLDRIKSINHLSKPYRHTNINFDEFFGDVIGTTNDLSKPVEDVVLRVDRKRYDYIRTKPLHHTQTVIANSDSYIDIQIKVKINKELEMLIISYGDEIEVLKPTVLRDNIKQIIKNLSKKYEV